MTPTKIVFDCSTRLQTEVELTAGEIAQQEAGRLADIAAAEDAASTPSKNDILREMLSSADPGDSEYNALSQMVMMEMLS